jgi:hypothetical protein
MERRSSEIEVRDVRVSSYDPPRIVDYGDLVELTAGGWRGAHVDHNFNGYHVGPPPKFS